MVALWTAPVLAADTLISGYLDVTGHARVQGTGFCVGEGCGSAGMNPIGVTAHGASPQFTLEDTGTDLSVRLHTDAAGFVVDVGGNIAVVVGANGNVGIGASNPVRQLDIVGESNATAIRVSRVPGIEAPATRSLIELRNDGPPQLRLDNTSNAVTWLAGHSGASFALNRSANTGIELLLTSAGNLTIKGTLTQNSDRDAKRDVTVVSSETVLAKVAALPITTWRYKEDDSGAQHLGPMAQDFHAAFGLGEDERRISPMDAAGVALAGIKALAAQLQHKDAQIAELQAAMAELRQALADMTRK
jgi:hypothetical protein